MDGGPEIVRGAQPAFLAEAQKAMHEVDPLTGEEMEASLKRNYAAPKELIERLQLSSDWNCKEAATALSEMRGQLSTVLAREAATIERHDKKVAEMQEEIQRLLVCKTSATAFGQRWSGLLQWLSKK